MSRHSNLESTDYILAEEVARMRRKLEEQSEDEGCEVKVTKDAAVGSPSIVLSPSEDSLGHECRILYILRRECSLESKDGANGNGV
jgi:hypothetical protein